MAQPLPPHLMHNQQNTVPNNTATTTSNAPAASTSSASKAPYGAGDTEDGYTLIFPNLDAFHAWRAQEEETQMVEFVKGDTHGSKAVPPRFKDHTKLVCARHSRSGRKKYVKKHPERVRKVPSRKLEGQGCSASISFKTYFDTDEVRACYVSQHSHEIGLANLPFTRRGRKAAAQHDKDRPKRHRKTDGESSVTPSPITASSSQVPAPPAPTYAPMLGNLPPPFPSHAPPPHPYVQSQPSHHPQSMPAPAHGIVLSQDRWDRMSVLFNSIRDNARGFEYPGPSVVALESVLIRLYLESPMGQVGQPPGGGPVLPGQATHVNGVNGAGTNGMASSSEGS